MQFDRKIPDSESHSYLKFLKPFMKGRGNWFPVREGKCYRTGGARNEKER